MSGVVFRWTSDNCEIVAFSPSSSDADDEIVSHYRAPTSVDDVVQQRTLTVEMNCNNYVHHMHDLLRLEEYTQAKLIAQYVIHCASLKTLATLFLATTLPNVNGTLHSKLALDFFRWPKSIYFWKIFTIKTSWIDAVVT